MNKKQRPFFVTVLIVLAFSMMWTVPVLADEGEPQTEEPVATETTPVEDQPVTEEVILPAETQEDSAPVEETLLEQLPEDTTIVVVDETGETVSLATQEAAEAITSMPDPQWCPVGAMPGSATCSPSFGSFTNGGLLNWLATNNPGVAGVIWIEANYISTTETGAIVLDGGILTNMANFALTVNGGWNGAGTNTMNPLDPSEFNVPFQITGWTGAITLNNLLIQNVAGASTIVMGVWTDGNITVNNVDVVNNTTEWGAYLDNEDVGAIGNVVVNDSTFNGNTGTNSWGLVIRSYGTVTLKNITANDNTGDGVAIINSSSATAKTVTISGANQFMRNGGDGLNIHTKGAITLANITAEGNGVYGAYLFNSYSLITSGVTVKGENSFNGNGWDGLDIYTNGAVLLNSITANDNGWDPARDVASLWYDPDGIPGNSDDQYGYDSAGKGAIIVNWISVSPKTVTLTGINTFNGNASAGLVIDTAGLLTISNLTANDNGCDLAYEFKTTYCAGAFLEGAGITITGYSNFSGNAKMGLKAWNNYVYAVNSSVGSITLNNVFSENNGSTGVLLETGGNLPYNITLAGINTFLNNASDGLTVFANGVVTLSNLTSNDNGGDGVYINNTDATSAKAVLINGVGTYTGNLGMGLAVFSNGAITTNGLTSLNNGLSGIYLDNCNENAGACTGFASQAVNVNGVNTISNSGDSGLYILSRGAVTITSLTTIGNFFNGVFVANDYSNATGAVTFKNYITATGNQNRGVAVFSNGAVTMANVNSSGNTDFGTYIDNSTSPAVSANVAITGTNSFNANGVTGLQIDTYGVVTLNNIFANHNGDTGAYINNYQGDGTAARGITLTGVNYFNGNTAGTGLYVVSLGAITVNKVTANSNGAEGAYLNNQFNKFSQPISVVGYGTFNGNTTDGLLMSSNGAATLANLIANNNGSSGASIFNNSLTNTLQNQALSVNVTLTGFNQFNTNGTDGFAISTDGVITLNSVTASYNGGNGLDVTNTAVPGGSVAKGFTLNGWNNFIGNSDTGLLFNISGAVVLNRVVSSYNGDGAGPNSAHGVSGASGSTITFSCGSLNSNEAKGYNLTATGLITLKGVFTYNNPSGNTASGTPSITRTCPLP